MEINSTHVFNPDWTPHVQRHEVWQLITNSTVAMFCLWLVWKKGTDNAVHISQNSNTTL